MHVILPHQVPPPLQGGLAWLRLAALQGLIRWTLMLGPPGWSHRLPAEFPRYLGKLVPWAPRLLTRHDHQQQHVIWVTGSCPSRTRRAG